MKKDRLVLNRILQSLSQIPASLRTSRWLYFCRSSMCVYSSVVLCMRKGRNIWLFLRLQPPYCKQLGQYFFGLASWLSAGNISFRNLGNFLKSLKCLLLAPISPSKSDSNLGCLQLNEGSSWRVINGTVAWRNQTTCWNG